MTWNSNTVEEPQQEFGGQWTLEKADIFVKYCRAYLTIMNKFNFPLIYFDGFAGSGQVRLKDGSDVMESIALQVLAIDEPRGFDIYYLVEKNPAKALELQATIRTRFPNKEKKCYVITEDSNVKIKAMADFMKQRKNYRALALLDPFGMSVRHESLSSLKGLGIDMWILFPSAIGVNRFLPRDKRKMTITNYEKIGQTMGLSKNEIDSAFYEKRTQVSLFEEETFDKKTNVINNIFNIYVEKLRDIWAHVSEPKQLKNSIELPMFHLFMTSQNKIGVKIANDIIKNV